MSKKLSKFINEQFSESNIAKLNAILKEFPNAKIHHSDKELTFSSSKVNKRFSDIEFTYKNAAIYIKTFYNFEFIYNDIKEITKIYSTPLEKLLIAKVNTVNADNADSLGLATNSRFKSVQYLYTTDLTKKLNTAFSGKMLEDCYDNIINFIRNNPRYRINKEDLDPKLGKFLLLI